MGACKKGGRTTKKKRGKLCVCVCLPPFFSDQKKNHCYSRQIRAKTNRKIKRKTIAFSDKDIFVIASGSDLLYANAERPER